MPAAGEAASRAGYVDRRVAFLRRQTLGFEILAHVDLKVPQVAGRDIVAEFRAAVRREPAIIACYVTTGDYDFLLKVVASSMDAFSRLMIDTILKLPGVRDTRSSFVMETVKETAALPI